MQEPMLRTPRMNSHKHARLTVHGRVLLVKRVLEQGMRPAEVAQAMGVSVRTVYKWLRRYREEGWAGLHNRSSRPRRCPHRTPEAIRQQVIQRRRQRQTCRRIAEELGISVSTVARIARKAGLGRLPSLEPPPPVCRYEHEAPGDLLHLDIKRLARFQIPGHRVTGNRRQASRGAGWEYVHVAIDDHSRIAFAAIFPDETAQSACRALLAALRYYARLGIRIRRILTDNGAAYRSRAFQNLCRRLGLVHRYTRLYTPRTNGKAERFIQTALREWTYARPYQSSQQRAQYLHV